LHKKIAYFSLYCNLKIVRFFCRTLYNTLQPQVCVPMIEWLMHLKLIQLRCLLATVVISKKWQSLTKSVKSNYLGFTSGLTEFCNTSQPQTCVQVIKWLMCLTFTQLHWLFASVSTLKKLPNFDNQTCINLTLKKWSSDLGQGFQQDGMKRQWKKRVK